ncbi:unnamed protein product, partial [Discosporangium mesarthrocarpum]
LAADGWIAAHSALGGLGRAGGKGRGGEHKRDADRGLEVTEDEGRVEGNGAETLPLEPAVTVHRRLVAQDITPLSSTRGYSAPAGRRGGGPGCSGLPNFKRFKKNLVMYGGEGVGAFIPVVALRSMVPKESERELVLAAEQKRLEEEEADANVLFSQDGAGGRGRAAGVGRTRRR